MVDSRGQGSGPLFWLFLVKWMIGVLLLSEMSWLVESNTSCYLKRSGCYFCTFTVQSKWHCLLQVILYLIFTDCNTAALDIHLSNVCAAYTFQIAFSKILAPAFQCTLLPFLSGGSLAVWVYLSPTFSLPFLRDPAQEKSHRNKSLTS